MRTRRFLLVTAALSAAAGAEACGKDDVIHGLPGNPKGMSYDDGGSILPTAKPPEPPDAAPPPPPVKPTPPKPMPPPPPGNPKGARYDGGP